MTTLDPRLAPTAASRFRQMAAAKAAATNPVRWVDTALGETLWSKQREIAAAVARYDQRIAIPSCHSAGKSALAAWLVGWWVQAHQGRDSLVVTTAPTYAQVKSILWRYIRRTHRQAGLAGSLVGSPMEAWNLDGDMVAFGRKPGGSGGKSNGGVDEEAMATFQGLHATHLLTILDEACGIPRWLWNAVESNSTGAKNVVLAIGNPDDSESQFYDVCQPGSGWTVIPIPAHTTPAFTGEEVPDKVRSALIQPGWVQRAADNWGVDSALYRAKVLAEFTKGSEDAVIPAAWIAACRYLDHDDIAALNPRGELPEGGVLGVDVARSETGDQATIVQRHRGTMKAVWKGHVPPSTDEHPDGLEALADRVAGLLAKGGPDWAAVVDGDGVGGGLVDMLRRRRCTVIEYRGNARPKRPDRFLNQRAEAHWEMRELIKAKGIALPASRVGDPLPDQLAADLGAPRWHANNPKGLIQVERKEELVKRLGRSPDLGDAAVMAAWIPALRFDPDASGTARRASRAVAAGILDATATPW